MENDNKITSNYILLKNKKIEELDNINKSNFQIVLENINYNKKEINNIIFELKKTQNKLNLFEEKIRNTYIDSNKNKYIYISESNLKKTYNYNCIHFLNIKYEEIIINKNKGYLFFVDNLNIKSLQINCKINNYSKILILTNLVFTDKNNIDINKIYCNISISSL